MFGRFLLYCLEVVAVRACGMSAMLVITICLILSQRESQAAPEKQKPVKIQKKQLPIIFDWRPKQIYRA